MNLPGMIGLIIVSFIATLYIIYSVIGGMLAFAIGQWGAVMYFVVVFTVCVGAMVGTYRLVV